MPNLKPLLLIFCFLLFLPTLAHSQEYPASSSSHDLLEAIEAEESSHEVQDSLDVPVGGEDQATVDAHVDDESQAVVQAPVADENQATEQTPGDGEIQAEVQAPFDAHIDDESQTEIQDPAPTGYDSQPLTEAYIFDDAQETSDLPSSDEGPQAPPAPEEKMVLDDSAEVGLSIKVWSIKLNDPAAEICLEYSMLFDDLDWTGSPRGEAPACQDFSQNITAKAVKGQLKSPLDIISSFEKIGYASTIISSSARAKNHENIPVQTIKREESQVNTPGMAAESAAKLGFDLNVKPTLKEDGYLTLEYGLNIPKVKSQPFPQQTSLKAGQTLVIAASEDNEGTAAEKNIIIIAISTEPAID